MRTEAPESGPGPTRTREIWLVRHGQTSLSAERRLAGWGDVPLTAHGREQARALRRALQGIEFDSVWSSDLQRAVETGRLAWGEPRQDPRLRELDFGALEGRRYTDLEPDLKAAMDRFGDFQPPQGESARDLAARLHAFLDELAGGRHLLFTHSGVVRTVGREVGEDAFVPTGTVLAVDWDRRSLLLKRTL
jgi:probable phosphoglycerate mutase